jgi:hypothetical protein
MTMQFLPEPGRWQPAGLTEGNGPSSSILFGTYPSTMLRMVPLPVSGRI